jgi:hypothetical protein
MAVFGRLVMQCLFSPEPTRTKAKKMLSAFLRLVKDGDKE